MNEHDTGERDAGSGFSLEAEHGSYPSFDTAMILLDGVVHVFAQADGDELATMSQPVLCITLHDGHPIGLAAVNCDLLWPAMLGQPLADKAFASFQVAISAEHKPDCIAVAVDGSVRIKPLTFDLLIGFIQIPFACDWTLPSMETLKQHGAEMQNPAVHRGMVHRDAAPGHHFFQIAKAQIVSQVPSNTQKDDGLIEMAAFEHRTIQLFRSWKPYINSH